MTDEGLAAMTDREIAAFLDEGGTGVLALARDDVPYAIPVSYGFDPSTRSFFLRLGDAPGREKREYLGGSPAARLVVYGREGTTWRSVVAAGRLEAVEEDAVDAATVRGLQHAVLPLVSVFDGPDEEVEFGLYRLDAEELTGRRAPMADRG